MFSRLSRVYFLNGFKNITDVTIRQNSKQVKNQLRTKLIGKNYAKVGKVSSAMRIGFSRFSPLLPILTLSNYSLIRLPVSVKDGLTFLDS